MSYDFPLPRPRGFATQEDSEAKCFDINSEFMITDVVLQSLIARMTASNGTTYEFDTYYDSDLKAMEIDIPSCYLEYIETISVGPNIQRYLSWLVGSSGFDGSQGIQGPQGTNGIIGVDGAQGFQGPSGTILIDGTQGFQGPQGFSAVGIQGPQGTNGIIGVNGTQGFQGPQGFSAVGIQGFQGNSGSIGINGTQGFQGFQGDTAPGVQGFQGDISIGFQGFQGDTAPGVQGFQGADGVQGLIGLQGFQGDTAPGTQGFQGFQGIGTQGFQGDTAIGTQGFQGFQGNAALGIQGFQGDMGIGTQGFQGFQGFQGDATPGTQGFQGYQGNVGPQGLTNIGSQGFQGDIGDGIQGAQGWQGTNGIGTQGFQGDVGTQGYQGFQGDATSGTQGYQGFQGDSGSSGGVLNNLIYPFSGNYTLTGKQGTVAVGNTATEIVDNNTSNTWIVVALSVGNIDGTNAADLDITVNLGSGDQEVVDAMEIAANSKVDIWSKNNGFLVLQPNETIDMTASAAGDLVADWIAIDLGEAVSSFVSSVVSIGTSATTLVTAEDSGYTTIASLWFGNIDGTNSDSVDIIKNINGGGDTTIVTDLTVDANKIVVVNSDGALYDIIFDSGTNDVIKATAATASRINAIINYIEST